MRGPYFAGAATETPPAPVFTMARATSPDALSVLDGGLEVPCLPAAVQYMGILLLSTLTSENWPLVRVRRSRNGLQPATTTRRTTRTPSAIELLNSPDPRLGASLKPAGSPRFAGQLATWTETPNT